VYLKSLDMTGFKSFADRTRLEFTPGMTAIVGPNGCGKSNVSDAVRWVLGEQSAKALRGHKMEDCIFNGTDTRKPLNLAEVSITFADCEGVLQTDYDEVTVTRRVFRSGEGQYFLNKVPCRLKDIHRLFMGTGIGTSSYSLMEQGRIDQILSSRPEDRREVFEEAAGITKFKSDKRESLRKLEQTDQNLLRLQDVIREVKRQIGSLQRQAGKARRYKEFREELKKVDVLVTREKLRAMDTDIAEQAGRLQALAETIQALHADLEGADTANHDLRAAMTSTDSRMEEQMQVCGEYRSRLEQTRALIRVNAERIAEIKTLAERDSGDILKARDQIQRLKDSLGSLVEEIAAADADRDAADLQLKEKQEALALAEKQAEAARKTVTDLRNESMELETRGSKLQNDLMQMETKEHANILRRERLTVEHTQVVRVSESFQERDQHIQAELEVLHEKVEQYDGILATLAGNRAEMGRKVEDIRSQVNTLRTQAASRRAKIELLAGREAAGEDFPAGARLVLDESNPLSLDRDRIIGSLAGQIDADPEYRTALQAVLRTWADAVVVTDPAAALQVLARLQDKPDGAARLLSASLPPREARPAPALPEGGEPLAAHVRCKETLRPLIDALLENVTVWAERTRLPNPIPEGATLVTRDGTLLRHGWMFEFWKPDTAGSDPMSRKLLSAQLQEEADRISRDLDRQEEILHALAAEGATIEHSTSDARAAHDEFRRMLAQKEGEAQIVRQESAQARKRLETVTWELEELKKQTAGSTAEQQALAGNLAAVSDRRAQVRTEIEALSRQWQELEKGRNDLYSVVSEQRVAFTEKRQKGDYLRSQQEPIRSRMEELASLVQGRAAGLSTHEATLLRLSQAREEAEEKAPELEVALEEKAAELEALRRVKQEQAAQLQAMESQVAQRRQGLDAVREERSRLEVKHSETRMYRENLAGRVAGEYAMTIDEILRSSEPAWEGGTRPAPEALDAMIADLRARIEAMGPVNLVAIEEYQELEERHAFLTRQHEDLITSKDQLMEAIRKINETTSTMFAETFAKINANFDFMFKELFNGGTAKLELVEGEDVLECGIDIIARPPGKRLQNVSLLSGGERTMTAVALLFAIYMIRPSPFCMLDELDAALDESNINRFVKVLKGFLEQSQFIVITHNRRTIGAAAVLYGVTMQERGVSRIVSMKFEDYEAGKLPPSPGAPPAVQPPPAAPAPPAAPPPAEPENPA
jgi:chromosome segregation protein